MILKHYANLDFAGRIQQTHYRLAGSGRPLILLHPSPLSSAFMLPLVELFKGMVTVFAPDTPGYGASDPLPDQPTDLDGYVEWLQCFMASQGIRSAGLYGSATGAQIAIQFAHKNPQMTDYLVVDNAVHFSDQERVRIMQDYFPDLTPKADGSHLQMAWNMSSMLYQYFPWFEQKDECRVSDVAPSTELVHSTALAYLVAGRDYDRAYRAAFNNEDASRLQSVSRPTRIIRWQGSILRRYADRLDDFKWPEHIRMVHCGAGVDARYDALSSVIAELSG